MLVSPEVLREQIVAVFEAWGAPAHKAEAAADVMVDTDLSGIDSHGVAMLQFYEELRDSGRLMLDAEPEVLEDRHGFAVLDAREGLGHPVAIEAMKSAAAKAKRSGIGAVAVRGSNHFGALGYYARLAVDEGCIGFVTTATRTKVASATGGVSPVLGTNPIAFSAPAAGGEPLVVDMSTSVVALNKVRAYGLRGKALPAGWVIDSAGEPLTDGLEAYELLRRGEATICALGGAGTENGGHKGFGLSLMVQILSSALAGAGQPGHEDDRDNLGHFFMAIDVSAGVSAETVPSYVAELIANVRSGPGEVLVPGEPEEASRRMRAAEGIPVPDALLDAVRGVAERAGAPFLIGG
ncbi:Ldh family oxidoreductase [Agrococcus casei]|uniref:Ldh family oxidoreductase n=1 Tax=Agrococcus casei TaxID=343512 RepID=UPI003F90B671